MPPVIPTRTTITLRWLLRLRWLAVAGQIASLLFAWLVLRLELPWVPLLSVLFLTALTNTLLQDQPNGPRQNSDGYLAMVIGADIVLLTVMLYATGGAANPFTSLYLVLIALAAMALSWRWLAGLVVTAFSCYLFIFCHSLTLKGPGGIGEIGCPAYGLHLKGMAVAFIVTAVCVAFFVRKMHRSLQLRDAALAAAETKAARADQFSALAALAAGVAHELGSPLGTIAIASRELERTLEHMDSAAGPMEDARLIRQEVERCRSILDRLDQRSTSGTGAAPESFTADALTKELAATLPVPCQGRLRIADRTAGDLLHLPRQPVIQALMILIQNACEADERDAPVELEITTRAAGIDFTVHDRGPGLSPAAARHAGEPFFTTKPPRQGMGLGLFLVRTLAQQLGGTLEHLPRAGGGTTARLTLALP